MGMRLDGIIDNMENKLSFVSAIPIIGTLAGGAKVLMGAGQGLTALAYGALTFIPAVYTGDYSSLKYSWTHIKHGLGNMGAGTVEAIPLVQTALYGLRVVRGDGKSDFQAYLYTGHEKKFMPYTSLVERDWEIGGANDEEVKRVKKVYDERLKNAGVGRELTLKEKLKLAKQVLGE